MYTDKTADRIILIHRNGQTWVFDNILVAGEKLAEGGFFRWDGGSDTVANHFGEITKFDYRTRETTITGYVQYIARSEYGDIITLHDLKEARDEYYDTIRAPYRPAQHVFRRGPVPGTCGSGGGSGSCYRNIHTFPEHRDIVALLCDEDAQEHDIKPRAKRSSSNLPNNWDDICRGDRDNNWKRYRKTQWREKK